MYILKVNNLVKAYAKRRVVDRVSFMVAEGEKIGRAHV